MRYLVCFSMALVVLATAPLGVSAQDPGATLQPDQGAQDDVAPSTPRTFGGYTLEELELRKRKAAFGLIAPAALIVSGVPLLVRGTAGECGQGSSAPERCDGLRVAGVALTIPGAIGMVAASILVGVRKGELNLAARDYTLEEVELRVKRARIGLISTGAATAVGGALAAIGFAHQDCGLLSSSASNWCGAVGGTGLVLAVGGAAGVIATGILLRVRKKQRRVLQEAQYRKPYRVRWDPARSCFVF